MYLVEKSATNKRVTHVMSDIELRVIVFAVGASSDVDRGAAGGHKRAPASAAARAAFLLRRVA